MHQRKWSIPKWKHAWLIRVTVMFCVSCLLGVLFVHKLNVKNAMLTSIVLDALTGNTTFKLHSKECKTQKKKKKKDHEYEIQTENVSFYKTLLIENLSYIN